MTFHMSLKNQPQTVSHGLFSIHFFPKLYNYKWLDFFFFFDRLHFSLRVWILCRFKIEHIMDRFKLKKESISNETKSKPRDQNTWSWQAISWEKWRVTLGLGMGRGRLTEGGLFNSRVNNPHTQSSYPKRRGKNPRLIDVYIYIIMHISSFSFLKLLIQLKVSNLGIEEISRTQILIVLEITYSLNNKFNVGRKWVF